MRAQAARVPAQGAGAGGAAVPELRRGSTAPSRGAGRAAVFLALPPRSGVRLPDGKTAGIGGGGEEAGATEGAGRLSYLALRRELGGLGGLGRGKGSGRGRGKGGEP